MNNLHRINDYALLKFVPKEDVTNFYAIPVNDNSLMNLENKQFFVAEDLEQTVWESGIYDHNLNKIFSDLPFFEPDLLTPIEELKYTNVHFLLSEGFSWDDTFGLHVIIKNSKTNEVLISTMCQINDFSITNERELIDGKFWLEDVILKIPTQKDTMVCQVTEILYSDIDADGMLLNFPQDFITLISEKIAPDFIKAFLTFDDNHYLKIELKTEEQKTLEKSILDYFEISDANINLSYLITYGNDLSGYYSIRVSNEDNKYLPINIGLNLNLFDGSTVLIFVSVEVLIDNKLMKRETSLTTDLTTINPLIEAQITHPTTNFPVDVQKITNVVQTIIDAKTTTKIVPILQPIFADFIKDDLILTSKNVYFDNITSPTYMKVGEDSDANQQIILTKETADGKFYFDLSELKPPIDNTVYKLVNSTNLMEIGSGKIII